MKNSMKKEEQLNIKLTEQEFKILHTLKKKYAINISQFLKNCMKDKFEKLEKENVNSNI